MGKTTSRRLCVSSAVFAVLVALAALPLPALAAEGFQGEGGGATGGGWVGQESGDGAVDGGSGDVREGSSLGSGAAPPPEVEAPAPTTQSPTPTPEVEPPPADPAPSRVESTSSGAQLPEAAESSEATIPAAVPQPQPAEPKIAGGTASLAAAEPPAPAQTESATPIAPSSEPPPAGGEGSSDLVLLAVVVAFALAVLLAVWLGRLWWRRREKARWAAIADWRAEEWAQVLENLREQPSPQVSVRRAIDGAKAPHSAGGRRAAPTREDRVEELR